MQGRTASPCSLCGCHPGTAALPQPGSWWATTLSLSAGGCGLAGALQELRRPLVPTHLPQVPAPPTETWPQGRGHGGAGFLPASCQDEFGLHLDSGQARDSGCEVLLRLELRIPVSQARQRAIPTDSSRARVYHRGREGVCSEATSGRLG